MTAYIIRRLLFMIPTIFGIMLVSFVVVQFAPGGPVERVIARCRESAVNPGYALGRDYPELDDGLLVHATFSGARRTTSFSAATTTTKKVMPTSAATMFVAHSSCGSIE